MSTSLTHPVFKKPDLTACPQGVYPRAMSPEASAELVTAVEAANGRPVRITDPRTNRVYVVLCQPAETGVRGEEPGKGEPGPDGAHAAQVAFWAALPAMLKDRKLRGKWVLFGPKGLLAASARAADLYDGLSEDPEGRCIERVEPRDQPPWEPELVFVPDRCVSVDDGDED